MGKRNDKQEMAAFISDIASNSIVQEDFTEGNEALNEIIEAARDVARSLGIAYRAGEGCGDD